MSEQGFQSVRATPRRRRLIIGLSNLRHLYQRQLNEQPLVRRLLVAEVTLVQQLQRSIEELRRALPRLLHIARLLVGRHLEELHRLRVFGHHHVAYVARQALAEVAAVEPFGNDAVEQEHYLRGVVLEREVHDTEIVVGIEHVKIFNHMLVGDISLAVASRLVEDGQGVAHAAVGFLGNHGERLLLVGIAFLLRHHLQIVDSVLHGHAFEIVDLAARDDGWQQLMLLCRGENEYHVGRRFLKSLEEGIECCGRQHVHLVDDKHLVLPHLRRNTRLIHQLLDILH